MFFFKRLTATFTAILTILLNFLGITNPFVQPVKDFKVVSYVVADRVHDMDSLCSEDFDIITDVILFGCATFDKEGNVTVKKDILEPALQNLKTVIGERDITITLNFLGPQYSGDLTDWYEQMAVQAVDHTAAFNSGVLEDNMIAVLDEYGFDGVYFDYEYPIELDAWHNFNRFLVSLDSKLGNKLLGIAVADWDIKLSTAAVEAVDYFELMVYDVYDDIGRHSTFETSTELSQNAGLYGLPLEKVHFGLPFYARPTDHGAYWYEYKGYYDKLDVNSFYTDEALGKTFWFNTPDVIEQKTAYAIENGFGGVMVWHYSCDLPSTHPQSLLAAIARATENTAEN